MNCWHLFDRQFKVPKVELRIRVTSGEIYRSPHGFVAAQIWREMIIEQTSSFSYYAELASMSYSLGLYYDGIELWLSGYTDKQAKLLSQILPIVSGYRYVLNYGN